MRLLFASSLLVVLLVTGFILTLGRMLSALFIPGQIKPLRA